jgi:hypothetical protein
MNELKSASGRAKGALALAGRMTPLERRARAERAAAARWGKVPAATHKGNFNEHFGVDAECYVLDDFRKTAVMTQRSIAAALGLSNPGGKDFERLVSGKVISKHLGAELLERVTQPIEFTWVYPGVRKHAISIRGYSADILIDVCGAILAADAAGKLKSHQVKLAAQARIITSASAKSGITNLVYALAGYNPTAGEVIQAFKAFVQEEARKYEKEFPAELYFAWQRLYNIPSPLRGKPWQFMHLTRRHVYYPLAMSSGKILTLLRALRDRDLNKRKLFQFLNEVGTRALRIHMGRVLEMAESSMTKDEYERRITARFGAQKELELALPPTTEAQPTAAGSGSQLDLIPREDALAQV